MNTASEELSGIAERLETINSRRKAPEVDETLRTLEGAADHIGRAWSGSFIGYHSRVYYQNLEPPPPGAHFSSEWGLMPRMSNATVRGWEERDFDEVRRAIREAAGDPDLSPAESLAQEARAAFEDYREEVLSILSVMLEERDDTIISRLKKEVENLKLYSASDFLTPHFPKGYVSRDSLAMSQGLQVPPHLDVLAEVFAARSPVQSCAELGSLARRAASHTARRERRSRETGGEVSRVAGDKVFIGHGSSPIWKDLKDFVQERLKLRCDEFNRVSSAGLATTERLSQMLDDAAVAFLVMTAEDEQKDGKVNARLNVVHEAGLFQGRLGFKKAIVLLEEGCEEFSNIHGLGQIRFPRGDINARFEKVREVLEREGLITP